MWRHTVPLNHGNCGFTVPVRQGSCVRDPLLFTFNTGVFESGKNNTITIRHIYDEFAGLIEDHNVASGTDEYSSLASTVPVIGKKGTAARAHIRYLRD